MESSQDNVTDQIDEVQGTPQNMAAQMRAENEQTWANSPFGETSKDLANAASDPGALNIANDFLPEIPPSSVDYRRSRASARELSNLASANAPGIVEDEFVGTTRRPRKSYPQLKQKYEIMLQNVL